MIYNAMESSIAATYDITEILRYSKAALLMQKSQEFE